MSFRCLSFCVVLSVSLFGANRSVLRVCADPNNLPFSNQARAGLENRLADLLAKDLNAELRYTWFAERNNFLKNSLQDNLCDVVLGVPSTLDSVLTTQPYYRSTYVFVERSGRKPRVTSLADPRLQQMRIGIHVVGDNYAPPAHLLARLGFGNHLVGYSLYGVADESNPPARLIEAVARGDVDIAVAWGPLAGYFSRLQSVALTVTPVSPAMFLAVPFTYSMSAAVRTGDVALLSQIQNAFDRECQTIAGLLRAYGIPQVPEDQPRCDSSQPAAAYLH